MKSAKGVEEGTANQLMLMLLNKMNADKQSTAGLAINLQVSYQYLLKLMSNASSFKNADRKVFVNAASYLGIPVLQAMMHAGLIEPTDFLIDVTAEAKVSQILERMRSDPEWAGLVLDESKMKKVPMNVKILIGLLYERVSQTSGLASVTIPEPA